MRLSIRTAQAAVGAFLLLLGCARRDLDLLLPTETQDPCLAFASAQECSSQAALGCFFQPNEPGCSSTSPECPPGTCRRGDPFVRRVQQNFLLNGERFRFVGVSSWGLLQPESCATVKAPERAAWLQRAFDGLVPAGAKVARFFAFQSSAGVAGNDFSLFDAAVADARRAGVRLVFVLEHGDAGCSQGVARDTAWFTSGYRQPDGNYARSYREFAAAVAARYRDEPTVLGYVPLQGLGGGDAAALTSFSDDVGQLLHTLAPNQLVSLDLSWSLTKADGGAVYRQLQQLPIVDFVDVDDYVFAAEASALDPELLDALRDIDKPFVIGEGAFKLQDAGENAFEARAALAQQRMLTWQSAGFVGALLWAYMPDWVTTSEEFDARSEDPLLRANGVLASAPF